MKFENFTTDSILQMLRDGVDPQEIGDSFADMLNSAIDQKQKEEAEERKKNRRNEYAALVRDAIYDYIDECHRVEMEDGYYEKLLDCSDEWWADTIDSLLETYKTMKQTLSYLNNYSTEDIQEALDSIGDFFKK